jgi:hypothetical protein
MPVKNAITKTAPEPRSHSVNGLTITARAWDKDSWSYTTSRYFRVNLPQMLAILSFSITRLFSIFVIQYSISTLFNQYDLPNLPAYFAELEKQSYIFSCNSHLTHLAFFLRCKTQQHHFPQVP